MRKDEIAMIEANENELERKIYLNTFAVESRPSSRRELLSQIQLYTIAVKLAFSFHFLVLYYQNRNRFLQIEQSTEEGFVNEEAMNKWKAFS